MTTTIAHAMAIPGLSPSVSTSQDRIALIDSEGNIVAVNDNWLILAAETGAAIPQVGPGRNYLDVCRTASSHCAEANEALRGIRGTIRGHLNSFTMDYSGQVSGKLRHFRMSVTPISHDRARFVVTHADITELWKDKEQSDERIRGLAKLLVNAQEEERERIAREMHDDFGSRIALLSFSIRQIAVRRSKHSPSPTDELSEIMSRITDLASSLRSISHHLHPPLLKHAGLCAALRALCEEFSRVRKIKLHIAIPEELPTIPDDVALCLFRVSQRASRILPSMPMPNVPALF